MLGFIDAEPRAVVRVVLVPSRMRSIVDRTQPSTAETRHDANLVRCRGKATFIAAATQTIPPDNDDDNDLSLQ